MSLSVVVDREYGQQVNRLYSGNGYAFETVKPGQLFVIAMELCDQPKRYVADTSSKVDLCYVHSKDQC